MQSAFMHLLMHELSGGAETYSTAHNILSFLFFRSGLLQRSKNVKLDGAWNWSHIKTDLALWFDDNAWMATLMLKIADHHPELEREFALKEWGLKLVRLLAGAFPRYFAEKNSDEGGFRWQGELRQPHWGSLVCQALAAGLAHSPVREWCEIIDGYHRFLLEAPGSFTPSDCAYALLGATASFAARHDDLSGKTARTFADELVSQMDRSTGNLPSRHCETLCGEHLTDTIYTMNWATLAMQNMRRIDPKYTDASEKMLSLLLRIQETAPEPWLHGCWRGLYDLESGTWGGGDRFEGGAASIYTGWTNAPISIAFLLAREGRCLVDLL